MRSNPIVERESGAKSKLLMAISSCEQHGCGETFGLAGPTRRPAGSIWEASGAASRRRATPSAQYRRDLESPEEMRINGGSIWPPHAARRGGSSCLVVE